MGRVFIRILTKDTASTYSGDNHLFVYEYFNAAKITRDIEECKVALGVDVEIIYDLFQKSCISAYTEAHTVFHNMEEELDYPVLSVFVDEFKEAEEKTMMLAKDAFTFVRKLAKDLKKEKVR